ncbi:MAG TPA: hypothetical protein VMM93_15010 [Vicinamibacterales bacterium]|nr:hypothetical protein [Vicinamibacterales bacterium]
MPVRLLNPILALVFAVTAALAAPAGLPRQVREPGAAWAELGDWLSLVATHSPGERDRAADEAARLSNDALGAILDQLQQARGRLDEARTSRLRPTSSIATRDGRPVAVAAVGHLLTVQPEALDRFLSDRSTGGRTDVDAALGRLLGRAALLHADVAVVVPPMLRLVRDDDPTAQATLRVTDGRADGVERGAESHVTVHLRFGNRLMELASVRAPDAAALGAWYRGVAAVQLHGEMYGDALRHLEDARRVLPDDPVVLFYSGTLHEVLALPRTQSVVQSLDLPPGMVHELRGTIDELRRAERFYRASLRLDPALVPAAVRHGRVLQQLGAHHEARTVLERAGPRIADRPTQYLASLFLGDALASLGDHAAAEGHYARAAALYPRAQTPALVRSALARAAGDREGAIAHLRETLSHPVDPTVITDPWRTYATTHVADAPARLATLRAILAGVAR